MAVIDRNKYHFNSFLITLILAGFILGCAPAGDGGEKAQAGVKLDPTPAVTSLTTFAPTDPPVTLPASTASPAVTLSPTEPLTSTPAATAGQPTPHLSTMVSKTDLTGPASPSGVATPPTNLNSVGIVEYGLQVYRQQYCGVCHRLDAAGTAGMFGPDQNDIGRVAEQRIQEERYQGQASTPAEYISESIVNPSIYFVEGYEQSRHHMPPFTHLSQTEVEALVAMLLQQKQ